MQNTALELPLQQEASRQRSPDHHTIICGLPFTLAIVAAAGQQHMNYSGDMPCLTSLYIILHLCWYTTNTVVLNEHRSSWYTTNTVVINK